MSASIPSVFNRYDFFGTVLPGYVLILVYIFMYNPSLINGASSDALNVLWTVLFLVAGPAVGLTLVQTLRIVMWYLGAAVHRLRKNDDPWSYNLKANNFVYYWIRVHTDSTKNQLPEADLAEAMTDFDLVTGVGLVGLGLGKFYFAPTMMGWGAALVVAGALLLIGTYYELQAYGAVMTSLYIDLGLDKKKIPQGIFPEGHPSIPPETLPPKLKTE